MPEQFSSTSENFEIHYQIKLLDPGAHLIHVSLKIDQPTQPEQLISLPRWIPGSYLLRDFAKHLVGLKAFNEKGENVTLEPQGLSSWKFQSDSAVTIEYQVYAWDLSVRKAHFDQTHAFFNGTSVFLAVDGQREKPVEVTLLSSEITATQNWKVATGMKSIEIDPKGFGRYKADDYQDLIEYPFEIGNFIQIDFEAEGVPHNMVFTGRIEENCDFERIRQDVQKICQTQLEFFGSPAPMKSYLFQVMVTGSDYGGLEHRNSTALICSRNDLPFLGMEQKTDGYLQFLELCSHEYFHTWNVKRIQPLVYQQTRLKDPALTEQLWWFEGVTSYYDALFLLRSDVIDQQTYLDLLGKQLSRVYQMPGRFQQSVAESSWYTWTKFYQQDEDAPNSIISYYTKGSVIALALDLELRHQTSNKASLDSVIRNLWKNYGQKSIGLPEKRIEEICSEICIQNGGSSLESFFQETLYGTKDYELTTLFQSFGYEFIQRPAQNPNDTGGKIDKSQLEKLLEKPSYTLGSRMIDTSSSTVKVTHIWQNQAAYHAGLSAGDELVAINGIRIQSKSEIETMLVRYQEPQTWTCHYFRRDELRQAEIQPMKAPKDRITIQATEDFSDAKVTWLSE